MSSGLAGGSRAIAAFTRFYGMLEQDATGHVHEDTIEPLRDVASLDELDVDESGARAALATTVVLKLNGGLGTSMGISGPKSALPVRDRLSFLDIIARQVLAIRREHDVMLPVVFMDSFRTQDETLRLLLQLAEESGLRARIDAMFGGEKINLTEDRAVLHVALRAARDATEDQREEQ